MPDLKKELEPTVSPERVSLSEEGGPPSDKLSVAKENLEVASWIEKIEKKFSRTPVQPSDVVGDTTAVQQPTLQQPAVTLPVTQQQVKAGKGAKTDLGIAWLITWVMRQMKLFARAGRKVTFKDTPET